MRTFYYETHVFQLLQQLQLRNQVLDYSNGIPRADCEAGSFISKTFLVVDGVF